MMQVIKCVCKTKCRKYKSMKKCDKKSKNVRKYIINTGSN